MIAKELHPTADMLWMTETHFTPHRQTDLMDQFRHCPLARRVAGLLWRRDRLACLFGRGVSSHDYREDGLLIVSKQRDALFFILGRRKHRPVVDRILQ